MPQQRFGEPLRRNAPEEITSDRGPSPGLGWEVSERARREIEEIEANIRAAEQRSGSVILG